MVTCRCKIPSCVLLLLCLIPLVSVSISVADASSPSNITLGSSLSASQNKTSYWLSPSSNFAYGVYQLSPNQHVIGIWLHRTNSIPLVWTSTHDCNSNSSMHIKNDGMFLVQSPGEKERPLFNIDKNKTTSYASMQDNGNFVLYGLNAEEILWQSFDYPTDTILPGQTLRTEHNLFLRGREDYYYRLTLEQGGDLTTFRCYTGKMQGDYTTSECHVKIELMWNDGKGREGAKGSDTVVLKLDSDGRLYLFDWYNNVIAKNFTEGFVDDTNSNVLYRAKLGQGGIFSLYSERLGVENDNSTVVWVNWSEPIITMKESLIMAGVFACVFACCWLPYCGVKLQEYLAKVKAEMRLPTSQKYVLKQPVLY